jgi:hypothetical protein
MIVFMSERHGSGAENMLSIAYLATESTRVFTDEFAAQYPHMACSMKWATRF